MKLRHRLAAVLALAVLLAAMPTFAASTNGVNKVITVAKNDKLTLENGMAPELAIQLKHDLDKGQVFYLELNNAIWAGDADKILNANPKYNKAFNFALVKEKNKMQVKAVDAPASKERYRIPMLVQVTGTKAEVKIVPSGTLVTEGKYEFALSNGTT